MPSIHFRDAELDDVKELVTLINSAYRPQSRGAGWTAETGIIEGSRTDDGAVAAEIAGGGRYIVAAERAGGPIVACVSIAPLPNAAAYLSSIAVDPTRQDRRIGRELLDEVERQATTDGVSTLRMSVISIRIELIAWYERRGFIRTGETLEFPYGDPGVGSPLRRDLSLSGAGEAPPLTKWCGVVFQLVS